jgi:hypothetical protein
MRRGRQAVGTVLLAVAAAGGAGGSASAQGTVAPEVVFQSDVLERTTGEPNVHTVGFETCDTDGTYRLIVENGVDGSRRVSSGSILLNGAVVVDESDLNEQVAGVVRPVVLLATNTLEIRLAGGPGGRFRLTVDGYRRCLQVRITAPAPDTILTEPATVVEGEVRSTGVAGVRLRLLLPVQGQSVEWFVPAQVNGQRFAAWVPLAPGTVQIAAVATDDTGRIAEDAVSVGFQPVPPGNLRAGLPDASPTVGFAPLAVTFGGAFARDPDVDLLEWDADGDGAADFDLADFATAPHQVVHTYATEGLYVARLVVRDAASGRTLTARVPINVIPRPDVAALWNGFRAALARGDVDGALRMIALDERERYRRVLEDLGADLADFATELNDLTPAVVQPGYATGATVRVRDGAPEAFLVHFVRDADGVWRIAGL